MKPIYIRTDKNGTKIYHDYTCQRCGGVGGADQWAYTGWTCYDCGGTGRSEKAQVIREYTEEYQAKLDAQREARYQKRLAEQIRKFHEELPQMLEEKGFSAEGKAYLVIGNTFDIKEELKSKGARWFSVLKHWALPQDTDEYNTIEISAEEVLDMDEEYGTINWKLSRDINLEELINKRMPQTNEEESNWFGNEGDKIEQEVQLVRSTSYESTAYGRSWTTETHYVYIFKIGNDILSWNTTSWVTELRNANEGDRFVIKASIKKHDVYKDVKQTVLQRVKVVREA